MSDKEYPAWICPHEKQLQDIADTWSGMTIEEQEAVRTGGWELPALLDALVERGDG